MLLLLLLLLLLLYVIYTYNFISIFGFLGVMGPDEYHFNVNNSVFTNYNAKLSLLLPLYIVDKYNM